jgi:regulator of protease activity HflC (stomatin/prohibitin superfamily)
VASFGLFDVVKINERQVAVITRFGKVQSANSGGWFIKTPFIDSVATIYPTDIQTVNVVASSASRDQQTLSITVNAQYRLDSSKSLEMFKAFKSEEQLETNILPPILQEVVKTVSSRYSSTELLTARDVIKLEIEKLLQERLNEFFVKIVSVNIVNLDWSDAFDKAIEAKVISEQQTQQKKQELIKEELEAQIIITKAKAEAESTVIRGQALKLNPETLEKSKIDKWDGKLPQVQGAGNSIIQLK